MKMMNREWYRKHLDVSIGTPIINPLASLEKKAKKETRKAHYYLRIAAAVASRSPCSRRRFGAVLVKNDTILSTGYNGSARNTLNCGTDIPCLKDLYDEEHYKSYEYCPAIHAEQNAIINAGRVRAIGSTLYLAPENAGDGDRPCHLCRRFIINAGVYDCWYIDKEGNLKYELVEEWVEMENAWMKKLAEGKK